MKELIEMLALHEGSFLRIPVKGTCFVISQPDNEDIVKLKICEGRELVISSNWGDFASFIRSHVNQEIDINNATLYGFVLVEVALAYVGFDHPSDSERKMRIEKVRALAASEPLIAKLMKHIDR